jgi:hypothetical protein
LELLERLVERLLEPVAIPSGFVYRAPGGQPRKVQIRTKHVSAWMIDSEIGQDGKLNSEQVRFEAQAKGEQCPPYCVQPISLSNELGRPDGDDDCERLALTQEGMRSSLELFSQNAQLFENASHHFAQKSPLVVSATTTPVADSPDRATRGQYRSRAGTEPGR